MAQSTAEDVTSDTGRGTGGVWARRAFLTLLAVVVIGGLLGFFGVRSRTVTARTRDGTTMSVRYASIARAGLDAPFQITVRAADRFDGPVTLSVSREYLAMFDIGDIEPEPSSSTATHDAIRWQFDTPPGRIFVVTVDLTVQSGRHWGRSGAVAVLDREDRSV